MRNIGEGIAKGALAQERSLIKGTRIHLRPIRDEDWPLLEERVQDREALWGPFQRFQMDHLSVLRQAYRQTQLLARESAVLLIETIEDHKIVGFVRYTFVEFPDVDFPHPEIGFGITDLNARRRGLAKEAEVIEGSGIISSAATRSPSRRSSPVI